MNDIQSDKAITEILQYSSLIKYNILYAVIALSVIGFIMNFLVLFFVFQLKEKKTVDTRLVTSIALVDIIASISTILLDVPLLITNFNLFYQPWFRVLNGVVLNALHASSLLLIGMLSLERFLLITKSIRLKASTWFSISSTLILILWLLYILAAIFKKIRLMPSGAYCELLMWEDNISMAFYLITSLLLTICGIAMTYFYLKIICYSKKISVELNHLTNEINRGIPNIGEGICNYLNENLNTNPVKKNDKVNRRCIVFIVIYNICFLPFIVALLYELFNGDPNLPMDCLNPISFAATSCCNPILTLLLHKPTRTRAIQFFVKNKPIVENQTNKV
ncbi:family A G protein-coupled receptor-like protein [Neoconidiobolus thromboides FSU 785]|nr:family A G protein-coupled receptor-like protein [Neoconidiobolus thromboides FSU 785]